MDNSNKLLIHTQPAGGSRLLELESQNDLKPAAEAGRIFFSKRSPTIATLSFGIFNSERIAAKNCGVPFTNPVFVLQKYPLMHQGAI